jgi:RNA polymerase sigma factor (sigma-70 family)
MSVHEDQSGTTRDLETTPPEVGDDWWRAFLKEYSRALLHVARVQSSDYDDMMDRYEYILEQLKANNYQKLKSYSAEKKTQLVTWLFVVARRLCVDYHRKRYGRDRSETESAIAAAERQARSCLVDLLADELIPESLPDNTTVDPETHLCKRETNEALESAVASLTAQEQLMITLRFVDGRSVREIARTLHFRSPFQVYRKLKKLLTVLRQKLEAEGVFSP